MKGFNADMHEARGLRAAAIPTKAKITFFQDKYLDLKLQYKKEDEWIDCFRVESTSDKPLKMPNTAYLGFSAETGELSDNFDIISVETRNMYQAVGSQAGKRPDMGSRRGGRGRVEKQSSGSWSWFFFKVLLFFGLCGGSYVGYTIYRSNRRSSRF